MQVSITGLTNTTLMREGETLHVEHTERIDRLAKRGFIRINGSIARDVSSETLQTDEQPVRDDENAAAVEIVDAPPKSGKGATRAKWAEWLELNGVEVNEDETKNDLIEKWMNRDAN